ncbi:CBS domain-containing protein [Stackebrandtia soli]|uniref:CBS domain-containing protein n=1 Tax=Stackebrandtia soli TaxID=1892856 RepID=UPI0039EC9842
MKTVADVMTADPACCMPSTSVVEAAQIMRDKNIGNVLVVEDYRLVGIVTDRDIVVRGIAQNGTMEGMSLDRLITGSPVRVKMTDDSDLAVALMREHGVRRVPVCNDLGRPVGVVSLGDLAVNRDPNSVLADISKEPPNN